MEGLFRLFSFPGIVHVYTWILKAHLNPFFFVCCEIKAESQTRRNHFAPKLVKYPEIRPKHFWRCWVEYTYIHTYISWGAAWLRKILLPPDFFDCGFSLLSIQFRLDTQFVMAELFLGLGSAEPCAIHFSWILTIFAGGHFQLIKWWHVIDGDLPQADTSLLEYWASTNPPSVPARSMFLLRGLSRPHSSLSLGWHYTTLPFPLCSKTRLPNRSHLFFSFLFLPVQRLWVMTDLSIFYITWFYLALCPLFLPFPLYLAAIII